ncbi:hypothetical protein COB11_04565 [Candidatus Aerophobetes bacterium]|uniref:Uncharacterized protein n=1 Tax=Aerophobetes bacterium TaxID=2030807 RepID=A0A2A4YGT0_UNCAE|nr:MAG: hypothetical protein COB11_04565 [Candidatus Aerophobetes bacterium]
MSTDLYKIGKQDHLALLLRDIPEDKSKPQGSLIGSAASKIWSATKFTAHATNQLVIKPARIALNAIGVGTKEVLTSRTTGLETLVAIPAIALSTRAIEHGQNCAIMNAARKTFFSDAESLITKFYSSRDWASFVTTGYWKELYKSLTEIKGAITADNCKEVLVRYASTHSKEDIEKLIEKVVSNDEYLQGIKEIDLTSYDGIVKHLKDNYFTFAAKGFSTEGLPDEIKSKFDQSAIEKFSSWFDDSILSPFTNAQCLRFEGYMDLATPFIVTLLALVTLRIGATVAYNVAGDIKDKYFLSEADKVSHSLKVMNRQLKHIEAAQEGIKSDVPKSLSKKQHRLSEASSTLALPSNRKMTKEEAKEVAWQMMKQEKINKTRRGQ